MAMPVDHRRFRLLILVGIASCFRVVNAADAYSIEEMLNGDKEHTTTVVDSSAELLRTELGASESSEEQGLSISISTQIVTTYGPTEMRGNAQDAMASLLGGGTGNYHKPQDGDCLKDTLRTPGYMSQEISAGLVEAFMHKVELKAGEKECLVQTIGDISSEVVDAADDAVKALQGVIGKKGEKKNLTTRSAMGMVPYLMDGAIKITSLVTTVTSLIKNCVEGDALDILKLAAKHLTNGKWLQTHFLVNGVNVTSFLADSIVSFEECSFRRFGQDVGTALRKIALSRTGHADTLGIPEGIPKEKAVEEVMQGFFEGFFARGMALLVTDSEDPRVNVHIDLHKCIAGNAKLFRTVWAGAWELFASISVNPELHQFGQDGEGRPRWKGEFMLAMLQIPSAMLRCGIDTETEAMLMEAVKAIKDMDVTMDFPDDVAGARTATEKVAKAVEAWTDHSFEKFGREIGKLLRELVLKFLPKLYFVDETGRLRRQLVGEASTYEIQLRSHVWKAAPVICGAGAVVLMLFAGARGCRTVTRQSDALDKHLGSDMEVLE